MGQKTNPIALRLQKTNRNFDSYWCSDYYYPTLISRDFMIRDYLNTILKQFKYSEGRFLIQHLPKKILVRQFVCSFFLYDIIREREQNNIFSFQKTFKWLKKKRNSARLFKNIKPTQDTFDFNNNFVRKNLLLKSNSEYNNIFNQNTKKIQLPYYLFENKTFPFGYKEINQNPYVSFKKDKKRNNNDDDIYLTTFERKLQKKIQEKYKKNKPQFDYLCKKAGKLFLVRHFLITLFFKKEKQKHFQKREQKADALSKQCVLNSFKIDLIYTKVNLQQFFLVNNVVLKQSFLQNKTNIIKNPFHNSFLKENKIFPNKKKKNQFEKSKLKSTISFFKKEIKLWEKKEKISFKEHLQTTFYNQFKTNVILSVSQVSTPFQSALFLAKDIVYCLERKISFREIKKILTSTSRKYKDINEEIQQVKGIRISCSGRLGGRSKKAQRARADSLKLGETSLHVFSNKIDFKSTYALTRYGVVGVKVWICFE